jgi:N-acetylneuraminate synthase
MLQIQLGSTMIDADSPPYIIAEIGVNHSGSLKKAKELIDLAKEGGANAAKFQTYKADTIASINSPAYWDRTKEKTSSQNELFQKYDCFNEKDYIALFHHCQDVEIDYLSTPFDDTAVDFLDPLMACFKIASADITNIPFLRKIASKKKPVLLSTGASNLKEIDTAISELKSYGAKDICLMHCILNYPTDNENAHLNMIMGLKETYPDMLIGYSDHTLPDPKMLVLTAAYLKGAVVIEKHFTYDKSLPGNDHYHAMDVKDLKQFCNNIEFLHILMGSKVKGSLPSEEISRQHARRSIVVSCDVGAGEIITENKLTYKRPGTGVSPQDWDRVVGSKTVKALSSDHILEWSDIEVAE